MEKRLFEFEDEAKLLPHQKKIYDMFASRLKTRYTLITPRKSGYKWFKDFWEKAHRESGWKVIEPSPTHTT
jgi:hypothetical protein